MKLALFIQLYMALPLVHFFSLGALTSTVRDIEQQGTEEAAEPRGDKFRADLRLQGRLCQEQGFCILGRKFCSVRRLLRYDPEMGC